MNATIFSADVNFLPSFPNGTTWIGEGNSEITTTSPPSGVGNDWWTQMQSLPFFIGKGFNFFNYAIVGDVISQVAARYSASVFPHRPSANGGSGGPMSVLVFEGPNNDVFNGTDAATITAAYNAYCAQARADGFFVVQVTVVPGGSHWDIRDTVNQNMFISTAADMVLDRFLLLPDNTNTLFYLVDGVHGSTQGNFVTALAFAQACQVGARAPVSVGPLVVMGGVNSGDLAITGSFTGSQISVSEMNIFQTNSNATIAMRPLGTSTDQNEIVTPEIGFGLDHYMLFNQVVSGSRVRMMTLKGVGQINLAGIPTSSSGLVTGDVWSNLGILTIV